MLNIKNKKGIFSHNFAKLKIKVQTFIASGLPNQQSSFSFFFYSPNSEAHFLSISRIGSSYGHLVSQSPHSMQAEALTERVE